ncbi:hypothetical protein Godav_004329 [Gossypium davidsonii]|uniref:Zinc knuckle CX2CX4HX4C domain-containing protein n=1 Tax=Gossypium davidsonii TaxID=34287 RepID=A0A7J8SKS2_GOSDV|nr:hypothetical protein [Gossypium davidsonii]
MGISFSKAYPRKANFGVILLCTVNGRSRCGGLNRRLLCVNGSGYNGGARLLAIIGVIVFSISRQLVPLTFILIRRLASSLMQEDSQARNGYYGAVKFDLYYAGTFSLLLKALLYPPRCWPSNNNEMLEISAKAGEFLQFSSPASIETELANLSLNEEEEEILLVQADPTMQRVTASIIYFSTMKSTLANLWHPVCQRGEDPLKIPLVFVPFWVQIHDVPVGLFSESLAIQLGNFIGVFLEYDGSNLGKENSNYMRIRFKYEHLSLFCFFCGRLGHNDSYCKARMMMGVDIIEMGWWDLSLRASSRRALAKNSICYKKRAKVKEKEVAWGTERWGLVQGIRI